MISNVPELERDIQKAICEYLDDKRLFFWRQNTIPVFDAGRGKFRSMPEYSLKGVSDILVLYDGILYAIEVKRPKMKLSEDQEEFKKRVIRNGGIFVLATSVDDVMRVFK